MSIPGVFQPFPIDRELYVDGVIRNNIPIQQAKEMGYDVIIAVSLDTPLQENSEGFSINPLTTITQVVRIVTSSGNSEQLALANVAIHPPVDEYNMMEFPKAREIYEKAKKDKEKYHIF